MREDLLTDLSDSTSASSFDSGTSGASKKFAGESTFFPSLDLTFFPILDLTFLPTLDLTFLAAFRKFLRRTAIFSDKFVNDWLQTSTVFI